MNNLLEYARFTFEEKYCSEKKFKCVKSSIEDMFCNCICIPGIAFNYIINAIKYCYQEFTGDADKTNIIWNEKYQVYVAESMINNNQKGIVNFCYDIDMSSCYYAKDICKVSPDDFVYLKIRPDNELEYIHYKNGKLINKERLLFGKKEKFNNSMDYFKLLLAISDSYKSDFTLREYSAQLFRLVLFLFPYTGLEIIEKNSKRIRLASDIPKERRESFKNCNLKILQAYRDLGKDLQNTDILSKGNIHRANKRLSGYMKFQLYDIYDRYDDDSLREELRDLIKKQFTICSKIDERIERASGIVKKVC